MKTLTLDVGRRRKRRARSRRSSCTTTARTGAATPTPGATTRPTPTSCPPTAAEKAFTVTDAVSSRRRQARAGVDVPQPHAVPDVPQRLVRVRAGVQHAATEPTPRLGGEDEPNQLVRPARQRATSAASATKDKPLPPFDDASRRRRNRARRRHPADAARSRRGPGATCTPTAPTATGSAAAAGGRARTRLSRSRSRKPASSTCRPKQGDFGIAGRADHRAGRPVPQRAVLPHGEVRPRPDAAPRLGVPGRARAGPDRRSGSASLGNAAERSGRLPRSRPTGFDKALASSRHGAAVRAVARRRQTRRRRARRTARRRREARTRPGPRPVRGLPAAGPEGPQARLEPAAGGDPRARGRREDAARRCSSTRR